MFRVVTENQRTFEITCDSEHATIEKARERFWHLTAKGVIGVWIINVDTGEIL